VNYFREFEINVGWDRLAALISRTLKIVLPACPPFKLSLWLPFFVFKQIEKCYSKKKPSFLNEETWFKKK